MVTSIEIERREDFKSDGVWRHCFFFPEKTEAEAREYVARANEKHPGIWRALRVTGEFRDVQVTTTEEQWVETERTVL